MSSNKPTRKVLKPLYEKHWLVTVPDGYDIHHMDLDPTNNDPENLVALPSELHQRFHNALREHAYYKITNADVIDPVLSQFPNGGSQVIQAAEARVQLATAIMECSLFVLKRNCKEWLPAQ